MVLGDTTPPSAHLPSHLALLSFRSLLVVRLLILTNSSLTYTCCYIVKLFQSPPAVLTQAVLPLHPSFSYQELCINRFRSLQESWANRARTRSPHPPCHSLLFSISTTLKLTFPTSVPSQPSFHPRSSSPAKPMTDCLTSTAAMNPRRQW